MSKQMSAGQTLYESLILPSNGIKKPTAKAFWELIDHLDIGTPIPKYKLEKFQKVGILSKDNKIEIDNPDSMIDWIMLALVYDGIFEMTKEAERQ